MGPLVWAAISEENARRAGDAQLFTYFTNQGRLGIVADLPHTLTKINKGAPRHKKEGQASRTLEKEKYPGCRGHEVLAIGLLCRCVCGKFALCDCFCKNTDRPIKFGGGGRGYRTTVELF